MQSSSKQIHLQESNITFDDIKKKVFELIGSMPVEIRLLLY